MKDRPGKVEILSAGSEPGSAINPAVAEILAERGLDTLWKAGYCSSGSTTSTTNPCGPGKYTAEAIWVVKGSATFQIT